MKWELSIHIQNNEHACRAWAPLLPGSQVYSDSFEGAVAKLRTIAERRLAPRGVENDIDSKLSHPVDNGDLAAYVSYRVELLAKLRIEFAGALHPLLQSVTFVQEPGSYFLDIVDRAETVERLARQVQRIDLLNGLHAEISDDTFRGQNGVDPDSIFRFKDGSFPQENAMECLFSLDEYLIARYLPALFTEEAVEAILEEYESADAGDGA